MRASKLTLWEYQETHIMSVSGNSFERNRILTKWEYQETHELRISGSSHYKSIRKLTSWEYQETHKRRISRNSRTENIRRLTRGGYQETHELRISGDSQEVGIRKLQKQEYQEMGRHPDPPCRAATRAVTLGRDSCPSSVTPRKVREGLARKENLQRFSFMRTCFTRRPPHARLYSGWKAVFTFMIYISFVNG